MNKYKRNILRVYEMASADHVRQGVSWYHEANAEVSRMVSAFPLCIPVSVGAGIVSALSPGLRWERNIEAAERILARESLEGIGVRYRRNIAKAERIRDGSDPDKEFAGRDRPKTRAFWKLLCDPADKLMVCVDSHAYSIWVGERIVADDTPHIRGRLYDRIAWDYVAVSRSLGLLPNQLQAITWIAWRDHWNVAPF
jgi:hypothetical protein